ncbi:hypothetical protein KVR01_001932 [Diaporthe batatas]|uniref:uncharacterized protein n=1 Tax=Diaporthe batatas TaxID=748121 RepID=UPI001D053236|nr:uncharacterized protein KVR01_001932 [Diaporthe batatas]KAG8169183.1 hypothetical protein KVR01_001932 [Diaporthe batatas]
MATGNRLTNKVALITGSSSGIGRAIALRYAAEGAKVICADLSPAPRVAILKDPSAQAAPEARPTHELIGPGSAAFVQTDVGEAAAVENAVHFAVMTFGRLDVMVNNAGIAPEARSMGPIHEQQDDVWDLTMRVNAKSVYLGCKFAIRQMLAQEPHGSGDRGWIVNMSSIMGTVATHWAPSYCASKGAVSSLTRQVALDYATHRIHCNAVCPGFTETAILEETTSFGPTPQMLAERHPFGGVGTPEDIAKVAVLLASDDASWITGVNLPVDGGYIIQ